MTSTVDARARWRTSLVTAAKLIVAVVAVGYFIRLLRRVDWPHVGESLTRLNAWQIAVLLAVVLLRQVLKSAPLALYVPDLGVRRALINDLSANVVSTIASPPADIALRLAMFRSWGIDASSGASGLTLDALTYYVARFGAPVLGFLVAWATVGFRPAYAWMAVSCGVVAVAIVLVLVLVSRGERVAAGVGRWAGRLAHRVSPSRVDPEAWSRGLAVFQAQSGDRLRNRSGLVALSHLARLLLDATLLVLCLRFVGVPASVAPAGTVLIALLISYPLMALPFSGLGALDAAIVAVLATEDQLDTSAEVAALVVWRVCLLLLPLLLGLAGLILWRRERPGAGA